MGSYRLIVVTGGRSWQHGRWPILSSSEMKEIDPAKVSSLPKLDGGKDARVC